VTQLEFARTLARVMRRPALIPTPAFALRIVLGREMADELLLASQRVVPRRLLASGYTFRFPSLEPALRHVLAPVRGGSSRPSGLTPRESGV
jgi:NAD dependent epimerase/dehydratase family enzyme